MLKRIRPGGKYCKFSMSRLEATGFCDRTGNLMWKKDLVKQMDWRGDRLVWNGELVGRQFVDIPNEQSRPQKVISPPDPQPVPMARPEQVEKITFSTWNIPFNQINFVCFAEAGNNYNCNDAPNNAVRKSLLENFNWSSGGGSF